MFPLNFIDQKVDWHHYHHCKLVKTDGVEKPSPQQKKQLDILENKWNKISSKLDYNFKKEDPLDMVYPLTFPYPIHRIHGTIPVYLPTDLL